MPTKTKNPKKTTPKPAAAKAPAMPKQSTVDKPSPTAAKAAWHEAVEAARITKIRCRRLEGEVDGCITAIRQASDNTNLTGGSAQTLADLARKLAAKEAKLEAAEAAHNRCTEEVKAAWKAWEPHATIEAEDDLPRIPRVAHLIEAKRREEEAKAVAAKVLEKPLAGLKALKDAAAKNGFPAAAISRE